MAQTIFLSMGSNVGDRREHLRRGLQELRAVMQITHISSLYETAAYGVTDQSPFLNLALEGMTEMAPRELLEAVKHIEQEEGRVVTFRWGPRVLDIDILLYGDVVWDEPDLTIPHPDMTRREFVLAPLAEIAPDIRLPASGGRVSALFEAVKGTGDVRKLGPV